MDIYAVAFTTYAISYPTMRINIIHFHSSFSLIKKKNKQIKYNYAK